MADSNSFNRIADLAQFIDFRWYMEQYPEVAHSGLDPLRHFLERGRGGEYDPNPLFDISWYLEEYPDVKASGLSAVEHYLTIGAPRGHNPHPLFDTNWYSEQYPDVKMNPLVHFLRHGAAEGRSPHPLFDVGWYLAQYPDASYNSNNPIEHYLKAGATAGYNPHPLFDTSWYSAQHPKIAREGINPLIHFVTEGSAAGADPNANFDTAAYLRQNPEAKSSRSALLHYIRSAGLPPRNPARRRIQIYRRGALGDVLLLTPALKALREKEPDAEIVVSTSYPEVLQNAPYIDHLVKSRVPCDGCDETFRMDYELFPNQHVVKAYAEILGVTVQDTTPEIFLRQNERMAAINLLRDGGVRLYERFCVLQLTGGWSIKNWPVERFRELACALEAVGIRVVILGASKNPVIDFGLDLRGQTSIRMAAAIVEKCAIMVTVDSGLMHFGFALRRPVVSLFGCTDPKLLAPDWARSMALFSEIPCRGCHHRQPPPATAAPVCMWESVRCMEELSTQAVISEVGTQLRRSDDPLVSVIVLHYQKYDLVEGCLNSIYRFGASCSFEVIAVANGAPPENVERLQAWRPQLRILQLEPNRGFSEANNEAAKAARGRYLLFLNDDTTVTPGWLDALVSFLETNPNVGIVGPKLLYPDPANGIQACGTVINDKGLPEHLYRHKPADFEPANRPRYYRAITGACMLIEKDLFHQVGRFDPSYGKVDGCEDTDLCFRLLDLGRPPAYCPASVVYHYEGVTRGVRDEHHAGDRIARALLRQRWSKYLVPDISAYLLLAEIEAKEGETWRCLGEVPTDIRARHISHPGWSSGRAQDVGAFA